MNVMGRALNGFFFLTALLLTFTSLPAEQLSELCALTEPKADRITLGEARRRAEYLTRVTQSLNEREGCKLKIAEALSNGHLPLVDAAACYRSLYEEPEMWRNPDHPCPQHDDGESWCREVIQWTERDALFEQLSDHSDDLHQRLEEELKEQLECNGAVVLPE